MTGALTVLDTLLDALRAAAVYNQDDMVAPAAILWPDEKREWEKLAPRLRLALPQFLTLGSYDKEKRTGPAIWLRCALAGKVPDISLPPGSVPVLYLPGVSRATIRATEECPCRGMTEDARRLGEMLGNLPNKLVKDRAEFVPQFEAAVKKAGLRLAAPVKRAILEALSERDETAAICRDEEGNPEVDPDLRDTENVPLGEDVHAFFKREVKPHVPDAWVNEHIRDEKDGEVGIVGYEINFNRYFYRYVPPRALEAIEADIKAVEQDVLKLLKEVTG